MKSIDALLNGVSVLAIVDNQWGDTGKGKIVDLFAERAAIIARGTGGANAGHTIKLNDKENIFHLIPSGILHDGDGKTNIIGNGVAVDPRIVCEELGILRSEGLSYNHLMISKDAHLVLPQHLVMDRVKESDSGKAKIGTTGRGIGPTYVDFLDRVELTVNDLLNKDIFVKKLKNNLKRKVRQLRNYDTEVIKEVMQHEHLESGIYYHPKELFDIDAIVERYMQYAKELSGMIHDTDEFLRNAVKRKIMTLLEGAQGLLLAPKHGTYPFVTSSDCSKHGLARGVGLPESAIDLALGIVKFYTTRVGEGPFPTELGGKDSAEWCGRPDVTREVEEKRFKEGSINSRDEFVQGGCMRLEGGEYGATTGRARRTGWPDMPLLRHAVRHNGQDIILTKIDVLSKCEIIKVCTEYKYRGPTYHLGQDTINAGDTISVATPNSEFLEHCEPVYREFEGWKSDIREIRTWKDVPEKLKEICRFIHVQTDTAIRIGSVGPDRNETIII